MFKFNRTSVHIVVLLTLSISLGCLPSSDQTPRTGDEGGTEVTYDPRKTICDPFGNETPIRPETGLIGNLYHLSDDQPRYQSVLDMIDFGHQVDALLFFNRLNIPTRPWDRAFYLQDGTLITNTNDEPLYEYFGVNLRSEIKLAPGENPGAYQFAILADDGAILTTTGVVSGGGMMAQAIGDNETIIVNNDGTHPTKMACATSPITLNDGDRLPIRLIYHQGPRYHISLVVMWRPWPANPSEVVDIHCDKSGNSYFFDSTQNPPAPKTNYYDLLTRGWKVLEASNYVIPEPDHNPCPRVEQPLAIQSVSLSNITRNSVTISWITTEPATSQVEYKVVSTGVIAQTPINTTLTTSHSVTVTGLSANTLYAIRGLSTTPGGQSAVSDEKAFRTLR